MFITSRRNHLRQWLIPIALGLVGMSTLSALAKQNIRDAFFEVYPSAIGTAIETVTSQPNHCGMCHYEFTGGGPRNPYGQALETALAGFPSNPSGRQQAVESIELLDPDNDGFSSLQEITDTTSFPNTPTFPGYTPANVSSVTSVSLADIQNHLVPSTGSDTTPPSVTVLSPNGGEILEGNGEALVEWSATDAGGIAGIDIFLSNDDGATFQPIALGLPNTGSHTWYVPNRPGIETLIRVWATDNAFNSAYDDSDDDFDVVPPPGGRVPSTLRDFDQPGSQPFEAGILNDPTACAVCHGNYDPAVEPYFNWTGGMMAQASRDILFEACMAVANQDAPDSGDLCLRCHIPRGWLQGRSVPTDGSQMLSTDMTGVSCDLCHRLVDPFFDPGENPAVDEDILNALVFPPNNFGNGMFVVDPTGARRGPFVNATTGHPILVSPFHREAALCGTCHDVSNPALETDGAGNFVPNTFDETAADFSAHTLMAVERTYSEWFYSDYNTEAGVFAPQFGGNLDYVGSCQDCHMRDVTGVGCSLPGAPVRDDLPLHDMTGGSTWMPGVIAQQYPGQVDATALAAGVERARYMLQNAASLDAAQNGNTLDVTVTNECGHKLPTGYPEGRRIWLNVRFLDDEGALLSESAPYDPATGTLTVDAEAKVYQVKPGLDAALATLLNLPEGPSFHFVLSNAVFKDNRIPPRGFDNASFASFGGAPVEATYADGQHWDVTAYTLPPGAAQAVVNLYYQSTSRDYIEFLRDENTTNTKGDELYDLWVDNDRCPPELMRTVTVDLVETCGNDFCGDGEDACNCPADCGPPTTSEAGLCDDGLDNDCDTQFDCDDADCLGAPGCPDCFVDGDCDDGLYCNGTETCNLGTCEPGTDPCPGQLCNEEEDNCTDCILDEDCDDGLYCNGMETCNLGTCVTGADPCPGQLCNENNDACADCLVDGDCNDGLYCNGQETCNLGTCEPGADPCPGQLCNENNDACAECLVDGDCNDGLYCNGQESCSLGTCEPGTDPCPGQLCDEEGDTCSDCILDSDCDDGNACTLDTCVVGTGCLNEDVTPPGTCCAPDTGELTDIDDGIACTDDQCNTDGTVDHLDNCPEGTVCDPALNACFAPAVATAEGTAMFELTVTIAGGGDEPYAILVSGEASEPEVACVSAYVQADGTLGAAPLAQTATEWNAPIVVIGEEIIAGANYLVALEGHLPPAPVQAATWPWGDVNGNRAVNFEDVQLTVFGFQGNYLVPLENMDVEPCQGNGTINFADIQRVVQAFQGWSYADAGCPVPCVPGLL